MADTPGAKAVEAENNARLAVYDLWARRAELVQADASAASLAAVDSKITVAEQRVTKLSGEPLAAQVVPGAAKLSATASSFPTPPAALNLKLTHSTQSEYNYCAPATTAMIIRMSGGKEKSDSGGDKMSQTTLAKPKYLATTGQGTNMPRVPVALKKWMGLSTSVYYAPSATSIKNMTAGAIGVLRHGVAYGTRENRNQAHYNKHPRGSDIDHYIAGYGYTSNGSSLKIADPVGGRAGWEASAKTFGMSASTMAGFVSAFGIIA